MSHGPDSGCSSCPSSPCGSPEWFAKSSLQLGIQVRLVSMALPTPRPGLRGSRAMEEIHMLHFPEVQLDVLMEASEGHKGAHDENKTARCPLCSSTGAEIRDFVCAKQTHPY